MRPILLAADQEGGKRQLFQIISRGLRAADDLKKIVEIPLDRQRISDIVHFRDFAAIVIDAADWSLGEWTELALEISKKGKNPETVIFIAGKRRMLFSRLELAARCPPAIAFSMLRQSKFLQKLAVITADNESFG